MGEDRLGFERGAVRPVECLRAGWDLVKGNYWLFLGLTVVGTLLAGLAPFGILAGPMMCGIYYALLRRQRGAPIKFEMLFKGFDYFVQSLIATLLMMIPLMVVLIPGYIVVFSIFFATMPMTPPPGGGPPPGPPTAFFVAYGVFMLVLVLVSAVVSVAFFFVYPLIVDRKLTGVAAIKTSLRAVGGNLGGVVGLVLLNFLLTFVGLLACYVGAFFVMPVHFAAIAVAYRQVFPENYPPPPPPTDAERDYDDQPDLGPRPPERPGDELG
jgi:hypothetical protein